MIGYATETFTIKSYDRIKARPKNRDTCIHYTGVLSSFYGTIGFRLKQYGVGICQNRHSEAILISVHN